MGDAKRKKVVKPAPAPTIKKLSNVLVLSSNCAKLVWSQKQAFAGVILLYALLSLIFVRGVSAGVDYATIQQQVGNQVLASLVSYSQLLVNSAGSPTEAAGVYQFFFRVIVSLALIWSLRQAAAGTTFRVREAYYLGMTPFIPYALMIAIIGIQLLPLVIGTAIYQFAVAAGIASSSLQVVLWLGVALLGLAISLYFVTTSLFGLLIVTLPGMTPLRALKLAGKLVRGRRGKVLRKLAFLPLVLLLATTIVMLPIVALAPVAAQPVLLVFGPLLFAISHAYVYVLYRELADD